MFSDATNKVTSLNGIATYNEGLNGAVEGYSTNSYFGYVADGYIQSEEELAEYLKMEGVTAGIRVGDMKYKDIDGDGKLTPYGDGKEYKGDLVYLGNTNPRFNYGVNLDMEWRGFDFSALIQGVGKRSIMLEVETGRNIVKLLQEICTQGTAIIMTTHNLNLLSEFPGKVYCCGQHQLREASEY